jgi:KUP system potassium uptake protein
VLSERAVQNGVSDGSGPPLALRRLTLAAIGVVYGDIGTSPLYAIRECFHPVHGATPVPENVLGVLSLVFWVLALVVVAKYLSFVMRADNNGEGGVLALLALVQRNYPGALRFRTLAYMVALVGTALLYGDGMITPAISVLSAVEGIDVALPGTSPLIWPTALVILVALFLVQRGGTTRLGAWFGPISLAWFVAIAAFGLPWIVREPEVLHALNPVHALNLLRSSTGPARSFSV